MNLRTITKTDTQELYINRTDLTEFLRSIEGLTTDEIQTIENILESLQNLTPTKYVPKIS